MLKFSKIFFIVIVAIFYVTGVFAQKPKSSDTTKSTVKTSDTNQSSSDAVSKPEQNTLQPTGETSPQYMKEESRQLTDSVESSKTSEVSTTNFIFVSPTWTAGSGLFNTWTAIPLKPWQFSLSMHGEFFSYSDFLISEQNEQNKRVAGGLHWVMGLPHNLEVFATFYSSSNLNKRNHLVPTYEPQIQMSMGDVLFGMKYTAKIKDFLNIGGVLSGRVYSSVADVTPDFSATSAGFHIIASLLGDKLIPNSPVPFRVHFNLGYIYDNSKNLLDDAPLANDYDNLEPLYAYIVKEFAFGISQSRINFSIGLEFPLKISGFLVSPILEYHLNYFTEGADDNLLSWQDRVDIEGNVDPSASIGQQISLGVRTKLTNNMSFDLGSNIAISHPGYAVAPSYPVYNLFAAIAYHLPVRKAQQISRCQPNLKIEYKTKIKYVEKKIADNSGTLNGKVVDVKGNPLSQSVVSFVGTGKSDLSTDEMGSFSSYKFKPGKYKIQVFKKGYKKKLVEVEIKSKEVSSITIKLEKKLPKFCPIKIAVQDQKGRLITSNVKATGKSMKDQDILIEETTSDSGETVLKIQPGAYQIIFSKKGYLSKSKTITMTKCEDISIKIQLRKKPKRAIAKLNKRRKRITIRRRILFKYNSAVLKNSSKRILDEVASILIEHPEIIKIIIEGHTDNKGSSSYNMRLSQKRAETVKRYLVNQGVNAARLIAKGYGRTKPRYANISARLRRKNRRVEFKIIKQK